MWEHAYGDYVGERSSPEIGSTHAWYVDRVEVRGGEFQGCGINMVDSQVSP